MTEPSYDDKCDALFRDGGRVVRRIAYGSACLGVLVAAVFLVACYFHGKRLSESVEPNPALTSPRVIR